MGTGYTRQSAAEIQTGEVIEAAPLNAEFNQLQNAFDSTTGHTHDGTVGEGPKISLTSSVSGVLPVANGGSGGINKLDATTAPSVTDDSNDGYTVGSIWVDVTNDVFYICVDSTPTAAIWQRYTLYDAGLTSIAGLTTAADKMIYTTASDVYATTDLSAYARSLLDDANASTAQTTLGISTYIKTLLDDADASTAQSTLGISTYAKTLLDDADAATARGTLGLGTIATQNSNSVTITGGSVTGITDITVADGGTGASTAANARTNLGLVIGTDIQAQDATLTALAAYNTNGILTQTAADTFAGRTLTGTANEVTVTNGSGVAGNPTISIPTAVTFTGKTVTGGTLLDATFGESAAPTKLVTFDNDLITAGQTKQIMVPNFNVSLSRWEVIKDDTLTGAASYPCTDLSAFRKLKIHGHLYTSVDTVINMQTSTNNGSSYDSGASDYVYQYIAASSSTVSSAAAISSIIPLALTNQINNAASDGLTFDMMIENWNKAIAMKGLLHVGLVTPSIVNVVGTMHFFRNQATARDAFIFGITSGTMTGYVVVEGWRG